MSPNARRKENVARIMLRNRRRFCKTKPPPPTTETKKVKTPESRQVPDVLPSFNAKASPPPPFISNNSITDDTSTDESIHAPFPPLINNYTTTLISSMEDSTLSRTTHDNTTTTPITPMHDVNTTTVALSEEGFLNYWRAQNQKQNKQQHTPIAITHTPIIHGHFPEDCPVNEKMDETIPIIGSLSPIASMENLNDTVLL